MHFGDSVHQIFWVIAVSQPFVKKTFTCRLGPRALWGVDFLFSGSSTFRLRGFWGSGYCWM